MSMTTGNELSRRVLVVDDSVDTAKMMKVLLKREGYEVRTAYDGAEALQAAGEFAPAIVLLDLTLPGITGQEVALELRKLKATANALIIAVSGYGHQGVPPGFDHLLIKPLDHDALKSLLSAYAEARGPIVA